VTDAVVPADPVRRLLDSQLAICAHLRATEQVSLAIDLERELAKILVLSAASYFESRIVSAVERLADGSGDHRIAAAMRIKVIKRQYHTYFDWDALKLGPFRSLFGDAVGDALQAKAESDDASERAQRAFLIIGQQRNRLIHGNFATYELPHTLTEWMERYEWASTFVSLVEELLSPSADTPPAGPAEALVTDVRPGPATDGPAA
jgi:hypothetical protein